MTKAFESLHPALRYHIVSTLGWPDLRPTQAQAIPSILAGENVLLLAPTAGGKTEAAAFPLLSRIAGEKWEKLSALYICPLKALLNNLAPRLERYASFVGMRVGLWHGDVNASARRRMLLDPPEILLTTPESIEAMMISSRLDHAAFLENVRAVVVDELHAFAGDDRGWHLMFLLARLERLAGRPIQRIGLTATVGNPGEILDWFSARRGGRVIGDAGSLAHGDVKIDHVGSVANAVTVISRLYTGERRLVFADSRTRVEEIASGLRTLGIKTFVSHASLSLSERRQAEAAFIEESNCVIVATSTLELGLDVGDLDRVIQVGAPPSVASFLQRMGRTGRRTDTRRNCLLLATNNLELLTCLALVALWIEGQVEQICAVSRPSHLFAQQILALALQLNGVSKPDLTAWLGNVIDIIPTSDREDILHHMIDNEILAEDDGLFGLGVKGEREFGRRHFSEIVAAFSEPLLLNVQHGSIDVGTVHPASLSMARPGESTVLSLGGRSWKVTNVDWKRRTVTVVPSADKGRSRWLGASRPLPSSTCMMIERIVAGKDPGCPISKRAAVALAELREALSFVDGESLPIVSDSLGGITIWTFSGAAASASIANSLSAEGLNVTSFDDLSVEVKGAELQNIAKLLQEIDPSLIHPKLPEDLVKALKFGLCLPNETIEEILKARTADPKAVAIALNKQYRLLRSY